ncbi:Cohesin subunit psc3 [Neolecta irregularis DAH-3]|uniref:Cohesin subunit psc3 n=1 Tax=Neolecta irregularis (strain DAH-3) TaxID=1198029 RepID=A0A1U7LKM9_NEOID|nr:Cohesin subunit psc3 [Neolecta irregularis DAH-3]|eukprot:OLL23153.1 Cohesin subunit psc3 [Neolecta irregularis DAH-3]
MYGDLSDLQVLSIPNESTPSPKVAIVMPQKKNSARIQESPKSSPSRRRSGRIKKAVEEFDPTPSSVRKRKRPRSEDSEELESQGDREPGGKEVHLEDDEQDEDDEKDRMSDYGQSNKASKKVQVSRKANPGKPRGRKAAKSKKSSNIDEEDEDSIKSNLFEAIKDPDAAIESVVADWLDDYQNDPQASLKEFVNFVLKTAGSTNGVTNFDIEDEETIPETLNQIQHRMEEKNLGTEYPLVSKKVDLKNFRRALCEFIKRFVNAAADRDFLYDGVLIESIDIWISPLSSSTYRPFRSTSTIIALHIVTCLCDVYIKVEKEHAMAMRQLEAETKKSRLHSTKRKAIDEKIESCSNKEETIKITITNFFDSVFIHRYRDVDAKIRMECVHELGSWMLKLPSIFFESSYLRYLGWVLSDTHAPARHEVIRTLTKLYEDDSCTISIRHFTEKFKTRLFEMAAKDADLSVRTASTSLLNQIRLRGFFEQEEIQDICKLLFDSERRVRHALGPFIAGIVEEEYTETIQEMGVDVETFEKHLETEEVQVSWIRLKCLVDILIKYNAVSQEKDNVDTSYSRIYIAALSLCEAIATLEDWEAVAAYLLYDSSIPEDDIDDSLGTRVKKAIQLNKDEEQVLLRIFNACVFTAIQTPEQFTKRTTRKKKKPRLDVSSDSQEAISRSLVSLIPKLLQKFSSIPSTAADVLRLEQLMKLDIYQQLRQTPAYEQLLEDIGKQMMKHTDSEVLTEAAGALLYAQSFESLQSSTIAKVGEIQDEAVEELLLVAEGRRLAKDSLDPQTQQELTIRVLRIECLASVTDPISALESSHAKFNGNGIGVICDLIERGRFNSDEDEAPIIVHAIKAFRWYFLWKLQRLVTTPQDFDIRKIEEMQSRRDSVVECLVGNIVECTRKDVVFESTLLLVDLYTMFSSLKSLDNDNLKNFDFKISSEKSKLILNLLREEMRECAKLSGQELDLEVASISQDSDNLHDENSSKESAKQQLKIDTEKRLSEITGKIVLAILSGSFHNVFQEQLVAQKGKLGPSYDRIISELEQPRVTLGKRGTKGNLEEAVAI